MVRAARVRAAHLLGPRGEVLASHHPAGSPVGNGVPLAPVLEGIGEFLRVVTLGGDESTVMALDHEEGRVLVLRGRAATLVALLDGREDVAQRRVLEDLLARFEERHGVRGAGGAKADGAPSDAESLLSSLDAAIQVF